MIHILTFNWFILKTKQQNMEENSAMKVKNIKVR